MKHLIIGLGNIGLRHGKVLKELGESVDVFDIDKDRNSYFNTSLDKVEWDSIRSILICTPPNTHLDILSQVWEQNKPILIEKPIYTGEEPESLCNAILERSRGTTKALVACNYRFCKDYWLGDIKFVEYGYTYENKWSYLDLIHMVDLCWEKYGKPEDGNLMYEGNVFNLTMKFNNKKFVNVQASNQSPIKYGRLNGTPVDASDMFINQMRYWLEVVRGRTESINPIEKAMERTKWLINLRK